MLQVARRHSIKLIYNQVHVASRIARRAAFRRQYTTSPVDAYNDAVGGALIPVVNKLQEVMSVVGTTAGLQLPQIVVVGGQSSGKSSVLENLVGRDFLPRGDNLVTRCPLILQLTPSRDGEEYGQFTHTGSRRFSFADVRTEILAETERIAGSDRNISSHPIILKLFRPNVLPLTLVDTPGMTRVAVGSQAPDIEQQIETCVRKYIESDQSIILAVHAANQDLATSDALKLAKSVDPAYARTIGVLTKLDIMDAGTDPVPLLRGDTYPLRLGFAGIKNRSQRDILAGKSIEAALEDEARFFADVRFNNVRGRAHLGTDKLARVCNRLLVEHIRAAVPSLKETVREQERRAVDELASYGDPLPTRGKDKGAQSWYLMHLLSSFSAEYARRIDGAPDGDAQLTETLAGGARIRFLFNEVFAKELDTLSATAGLSAEEIRIAIRNAAGARASLFVPERAFEALVRRQIKKLAEPCQKLLDQVLDEMIALAAHLDVAEINRFAVLRQRVIDATTEHLRESAEIVAAKLRDLIDVELSYVNTSHPDFVGGAAALAALSRETGTNAAAQSDIPLTRQTPTEHHSSGDGGSGFFGFLFGGGSDKSGGATRSSRSSSSAPRSQAAASPASSQFNYSASRHAFTDREMQQIRLMTTLLDSYVQIVKRNVRDLAVKTIMCFLVNRCGTHLNEDLVRDIYDEKRFAELLAESDEAVEKRELCRKRVEVLRSAKKIIQELEVIR